MKRVVRLPRPAPAPENFLRLDVAFENGCRRVLEGLGREFQLDLWRMFEKTVKKEARYLRRYNPDAGTRAKVFEMVEGAALELRRKHAGTRG